MKHSRDRGIAVEISMGSKAAIETRNARESSSKHGGDEEYLVAEERENEIAEVTGEKIESRQEKR